MIVYQVFLCILVVFRCCYICCYMLFMGVLVASLLHGLAWALLHERIVFQEGFRKLNLPVIRIGSKTR